jgi:hypothetical protein
LDAYTCDRIEEFNQRKSIGEECRRFLLRSNYIEYVANTDDREKYRKLLIWLLKRKKKKRRRYLDKSNRLDSSDTFWKLGDPALAWMLGSGKEKRDDLMQLKAIGKKKKKRKITDLDMNYSTEN